MLLRNSSILLCIVQKIIQLGTCCVSQVLTNLAHSVYCKSSIKPPREGGGLIEKGGLFEGGEGLWNVTKTMVSFHYKQLEYKVEKLKYMMLEVMQRRIKNKSELPVGD